jgi:hypothetical protein
MPTPTFDSTEEAILTRIPWEILAGAALLGLGAGLLLTALDGLFVLAGGLTSALGFVGMKRSLPRILAADKSKSRAAGLKLIGLRFVLILLVLSSIILTQPKEFAAFAAGLSMVVPVFLLEALRTLSRTRSWKG